MHPARPHRRIPLRYLRTRPLKFSAPQPTQTRIKLPESNENHRKRLTIGTPVHHSDLGHFDPIPSRLRETCRYNPSIQIGAAPQMIRAWRIRAAALTLTSLLSNGNRTLLKQTPGSQCICWTSISFTLAVRPTECSPADPSSPG
jgi:hypothetical protein